MEPRGWGKLDELRSGRKDEQRIQVHPLLGGANKGNVKLKQPGWVTVKRKVISTEC
jgi:hypothetical protein